MTKILASVTCLALLACGQAADDAPPVSGIDQSGFDLTTRPQDDFHRYVNGKWIDENEIPPDFPMWGTAVKLFDESEKAQQAIIEELAARDDLEPGSEEQKVRDYFVAFMDTARVEEGAEPVAELLARVDAVSTRAEWAVLAGELARYGVQSPISMFIAQDPGDSRRYIATLWQSGLGLPNRNYYFEEGESFDEIRSRYPEYIQSLFGLAGLEAGAGEAEAVYGLERRLAELHWLPEETREADRTYNLFAVSDLGGLTSAIDWQGYLGGRGIGAETEIVIGQPDYITGLGEVLAGVPLEDLKAYTRFKILQMSASYLSSAFYDASFEFNSRLLAGVQEQPERWKRAVRSVNGNLGEALGKVYVDRHFPPEAKQRMEQLVDNLLVEFGVAIEELEWMSEETKARAQEKRAKFTTKIGYPDEWRDYSALEIAPDDLYGNAIRGTAFEYAREIDKLGKPIDRGEWGMTPQTVNAYHNPRMNEIVFPAAILQPPFFNLAADDAVNYGAIGGVIGHEIGHAFDDQGRKYDGDGNLNDWWTEADAEAFAASAARLVEQYDAYSPIEGLHVNGQLTLGENIGDLTGLVLGYRAYRRSLGGEEAPVIDGLTGDQRFFMGWAQVWRSKMSDELLRQIILADPHSPAEFRVVGPLRHVPEFYAAFDVQEGDGMYLPPAERVKIW
jgi:predicted metalloendopeptidase